jgi:ATP-dependent Lhr-like helicase
MRDRRAPAKRGGNRYGLPPELAATNHLGKQLDRKRAQESRATRLLRAEQAPLDFHAALPEPAAPAGAPATADEWFAARGWTPFAFQRETWAAMGAGQSGLLHASTGTGKTYAVWFGALDAAATPGVAGKPLTVLWITPMRALAADTVRALSAPLAALGLDWRVGARTGDTASAEKTRQADKPPPALVTTPESLTLMLARADAREQFRHLKAIIVDEWHELMGNKRGVQTQLALARLKRWQPSLMVWGLSATLGNLDAALDALHGAQAPAARMVQGTEPKELVIDTLIPATMERFPWGGHIGLKLLPEVVAEIAAHSTTLVFTNVRSQAEIWYQALLAARPDWAGLIALHHGSLDREIREWVEAGLKQGTLKAVVCTSSLDLGVDFLPVERVLQIGSAKGIARLLQRAGRSGHAPGRTSRITLVPTNAMELIEAAAAREAGHARRVESRFAPSKPLDVLVQHLVTIALGGGFVPDDLYDEVRSAHSYRDLTRAEFDWALGFVADGGALSAYPDYHRVAPDEGGIWRVPSQAIARRHRMSVGTIVSDTAMHVAWMSGGRIGSIEESFIARLKRGDAFTFGGRVLELVRVQDMTAYVKKAARGKGVVPQWNGARMSFSGELAEASLAVLGEMQRGVFATPEALALKTLVDLQRQWSALPGPRTLVFESIRSAEGHHLFAYPFAGRMVHIGLASLLAWRAARDAPGTFSISMNDYGFELLSAAPFDWEALVENGLLDEDRLLDDVQDSLNASELAQRRFREIARIAGLVFQGFPGAPKSTRQVQASSGLFFEVFRKHDSGNLLLSQAGTEALEQELEIRRLRETLTAMRRKKIIFTAPRRFTPFAFPLMVERLREAVSTEKLADRVQRLLGELEGAAQGEAA